MKHFIVYAQNNRDSLTMVLAKTSSLHKLNRGTLVEHIPYHPEVKGSSPATAIGTGREGKCRKKKYI
jgi:hypothetical protein